MFLNFNRVRIEGFKMPSLAAQAMTHLIPIAHRPQDLVHLPFNPRQLVPADAHDRILTTHPSIDFLRRCLRLNSKNSSKNDSPTIMIVDDIESNRILLKLFLDRRPVKTLLASSGREALALLDFHSLQMVFMDLSLPPGIDGYETMKLIRKWEREHGAEPMYAVALTAAFEEFIKPAVDAAGFDELLIKSSDFDQVLKILDRFLGHQR